MVQPDSNNSDTATATADSKACGVSRNTTIGVTLMPVAAGEIAETGVDSKRIANGLRADMLSSTVAPLFNAFTQTAFAQNVGLVAITGIRTRFVGDNDGNDVRRSTVIIYNTATTANGFLADPHDSLEWLFRVRGEAPDMSAFTESVTAFVMGSSTYEWLLTTGGMRANPAQWQEFFGHRPVHVFTSRKLDVPEGADVRFVSGSVAETLTPITEAAENGTVWLMGGGDLVGQFLDVGALDRIIMTLAPAFLVGGKPLLPRTVHPDRLTLRSARTVGQFVEITYDVAGAARPTRNHSQ